MEPGEINYPPFPSLHATVSQLLNELAELRVFLLEHRFLANEQFAALGREGEVIPPPEYLPQIPDLSRYQVISVVDTFKTHTLLRKFRCDWDALVRDCEDCWLAKASVERRLELLQQGVQLLVGAFITQEVREAHLETFRQKMAAYRKALIKQLGIPPEMQANMHFIDAASGEEIPADPAATEEIDFDKLFHGDPDEPEAPPDEAGGNPDATD